jgi:CBS domain containing-hemolysin-like protein
MHPVHFVPESAPLNRILLQFFEHRRHLFVVVDEFGGIAGVISLEDILEEIVGREIIDETDRTMDMQQLAKEKRQLLLKQNAEPKKSPPDT